MYQKKIGTYDKQQWETSIEQKILNGLNNISMRSTKPNTNLIDLDLVRGSSFTKAKPQHGLVTVAKQATLRCVLLPFYAKWWIRRTSKLEFGIFLALYLLLWANITIYFIQGHSSKELDMSMMLPYTEILIPFTMTWVMTLIFSQIVSTKPLTEPSKKTRGHKPKQFRRRRNQVRKNDSRVSFADSSVDSSTPKVTVTQPEEEVDVVEPVPKNEETEQDDPAPSDEGNKEEEEDIPVIQNDAERRDKCYCKSRRPLNFLAVRRPRTQGDDDGFESFCGNGSRTSEEEIPTSPDCHVCKKCNRWIRQVQGVKNFLDNRSNSESRAFSSDSESEADIRRLPSALRKMNYSHVESTLDDTDEFTEQVEWMGVTTNSDDCSYTSDMDDVRSNSRLRSSCEYNYTPTAILNPPSAKVSCTVWERREIKKADLSMLDISSAIIARVESMPESMDYFYIGVCVSVVLAFLPIIHRSAKDMISFAEFEHIIFNFVLEVNCNRLLNAMSEILNDCYGTTFWERIFRINASVQRCTLATFYFFLLSVAERTFKQRFLYAKLFSHLTSFRKAQKSKLPHFRLNKVRNIKTWLSVRAYLKRRGPQRSVDVIVSTAFILMMMLMSFLCIELLKETLSLNILSNVEALVWCFGLGIFLLRFLTLGTRINKKYRNLSVLLTEQINLHLQIEQKPHKKEELNVANNVLKLAIDLLKELESPFKIIGFSANPIIANITKVVILSAFSGVLSDMLGFKLKLHKIKIK
ncbi:protein phtf isoform X2 [Coccinella septempunctata]|uniref:protein phtf isoform X2 n=1 Tax=Coccinella septempunctata TaxID=41139 RepID=UPI001D07664D|nr:protein phtf isoform X2 [Coccinella septempunctata]